MTDDWRNGGFGLYIHWPFCQAKCPYCDFNSHVSAKIDQNAWIRAYISELDRYRHLTSDRVLNSIFFGGGTPSLMHPDTVATVIDHAKSIWRFANDVEITLEANPGSVEAQNFNGYRDAGVNRVSMGIQALNDADLKRLGRIHSVAEAQGAFEIARKAFDRVSFDLIYARQGQSLSDWDIELKTALSMAVDHLSLYQLTIEQGTAFGDRYNRGKLRDLPDDDTAAEMYFRTQEICEAAGMGAYEVSNHAKPGSESRHNLIYWRYGDYIGIGPGAHGRLTLNGQRFATETHLQPGKWLAEVTKGTGESEYTSLTSLDAAHEFLMMGLRLSEGVRLTRFEEIAGLPLPSDELSYLQDMGFVLIENGQLKVSGKGRPILNAILRELLVE